MVSNATGFLCDTIMEITIRLILIYIVSLGNILLGWLVLRGMLLRSGIVNRLVILIFYGRLIMITFVMIIPNGIRTRVGGCVLVVYLVHRCGIKIFGFLIVLLWFLVVMGRTFRNRA